MRANSAASLDVTHGLALFGVIVANAGSMIVRSGTSQGLNFISTAIKAGYNNGQWNGATSPFSSSTFGRSTPLRRDWRPTISVSALAPARMLLRCSYWHLG